MPQYITVAVNIPTQQNLYDYHLPSELEGQVKPGHLVEVPFGRQKTYGVVSGFIDKPSVPKTRPISSLVDADIVLTEARANRTFFDNFNWGCKRS